MGLSWWCKICSVTATAGALLGWHFAARVLPPEVGEDSLASALYF